MNGPFDMPDEDEDEDDEPDVPKLGGVRRLNLPYCGSHHEGCACREEMVRQGLEWIAKEIKNSMMKRDDAPCSAETHMESALRMCVDLRNLVRVDKAAIELAEDCHDFV